MSRINVREMYLGGSIKAFVTYVMGDDGDTYYTIFINSALCDEKKRKAYQHEIEHIERGDFDSMLHASRLEYLAHNLCV